MKRNQIFKMIAQTVVSLLLIGSVCNSAFGAELRCDEQLPDGSWTPPKSSVVPGLYKDEQGNYGFIVNADPSQGLIEGAAIFEGPLSTNNPPKVSVMGIHTTTILLNFADVAISCSIQ